MVVARMLFGRGAGWATGQRQATNNYFGREAPAKEVSRAGREGSKYNYDERSEGFWLRFVS